MVRTEIVKGDYEGLQNWIINFMLNSGEFHYVHASYYEDYKYVNDVIDKIITKFDDFADGVINSINFKTVVDDIDDNKIILTQVNIYSFKKVEKVLGASGYILFVCYENPDASWLNKLFYYKTEEELIQAKDFIIKLEVAGLEKKIQEFSELKNDIFLNV